MRRLSAFLLCVLLLSGYTAAPAPAAETAEAPAPIPEETTGVTLTIGRKLALPVTEDGIRAYYQSLDGFDRYVLGIREENGDFLVWSAAMPYTDTGEAPDEDTRFDWIFGETGYCYALLEGRYTMDEVLFAGQGSITLNAADEQSGPITISAGLDRSLINTDTGEPVPQQNGLYCAAEVRASPREIPLQDITILILPGNSTAASLEAVYPGADSLELVFDTSEQAAFPQLQICYNESLGQLSLTCLETDLRCTVSGSNLYMKDIRAEHRDTYTTVTCFLGTALPEESWMHSAHANAIQVETAFLPGYDWSKGVLRLTFRPFMG